MWSLSFALLLSLRLAGVARAVYTLEEVQQQINLYLNHNTTQAAAGCALACDFLSAELPEQLSYPGSDDYEYQQARYWSIQQGRTAPACRFAPEDAEQVSFAVLTSRSSNCSFSVKSGGHAAFAGASNIEDGLTIDLIHLNDITVSADQRQASLGPGNVWYDVYSALSPMGLTVIGGRVSAIGVGGLTLGGGISFFSNRYGWACDNVNAYEVVFADGSIHEVTSMSDYDDLYWALRGGGNNFGIVTRFDVLAYPQGDLWGGSQTFLYTDWTADALNDALYYFDEGSRADPDAHVYIAYGYVQVADIYLIITSLQYAKPEPYPAVLHNFTSVPGAFLNTLRVDDLPSMTREFDNTTPQAARQSFWTLTVRNDRALTEDILQIYKEEVQLIKHVSGIAPTIIFQLITNDVTRYFSKNGGNPFGIEDSEGTLNLINIAISWDDAEDDERVYTAAQNMVDRSSAAAQTRSLNHPFLYQNYAALQQDVFSSYGRSNLDRLQAVSAKYDPDRVWQDLQRGYFKL